jgi:hypothetical protein
MRNVVWLIFIVVQGYAAACYAAEPESPFAAEREDEAFSHVLDHLGYLHFLTIGNSKQALAIVNVNLNKYLSGLREVRGAIRNDAYRAGEMRTLNAIALLWEKNPPFQGEEWTYSERNAFWWPHWREAHDKNLELLQWARARCAQRAELKCRTAAPSAKVQ